MKITKLGIVSARQATEEQAKARALREVGAPNTPPELSVAERRRILKGDKKFFENCLEQLAHKQNPGCIYLSAELSPRLAAAEDTINETIRANRDERCVIIEDVRRQGERLINDAILLGTPQEELWGQIRKL